jgi:SAM-dependent methyltransferase
MALEHLGGFKPADKDSPHGDAWTWTPLLWDYLLDELQPHTLLDVGCGEGHSTQYFIEKGIDAYGVDGSLDALAHTVIAPLSRFLLHDFTQPIPSQTFAESYDMIWCCEFVEHVKEEFLLNVLNVLRRGKVVCMTHALPGQEGHHHVNCQPAEYWIEKMQAIGFSYDRGLSLASRVFAPNIHWGRSGMTFRKIA